MVVVVKTIYLPMDYMPLYNDKTHLNMNGPVLYQWKRDQ